jgi:Domain of Unknown Function (DUF1206)
VRTPPSGQSRPMSDTTSAQPAPLREAQQQGEQVARRPEFEWLARSGIFARGVVYGLIAVLAIKLALGDGGKATDQQGALKTIAQQPFGKVLLILVAIGLFGYAAWRLIRAAIGHGIESGDDDGKERIAGVVSGVSYGILCITAVKILAGSGGGGSNPGKTTGGVLDWPLGTWLVGIVGVIFIVDGLDQARRGITKSFCEKSKTEQMSQKVRKVFTVAGVVGYLARAVVFALIGYFLIKAAIEFDPKEAIGLDGALAKLGHASYGPVLLGIVAAGLLGFGAYSMLDGRYRRV